MKQAFIHWPLSKWGINMTQRKYSEIFFVIVDDRVKNTPGVTDAFSVERIWIWSKRDLFKRTAGLDFLAHHKIDVVLTDICMPTMNGIELNQQINEKHLDSLVVYLTGYSDFQYMQAAIREHAADYLLKPIKHEELYTCLQKIHQKLDKNITFFPMQKLILPITEKSFWRLFIILKKITKMPHLRKQLPGQSKSQLSFSNLPWKIGNRIFWTAYTDSNEKSCRTFMWYFLQDIWNCLSGRIR